MAELNNEPEKIREQDPLKQGLKLPDTFCWLRAIKIREQDPLKQGLKQMLEKLLAAKIPIREQDPLKQGLKLKPSAGNMFRPEYS